jgi:hypothetical protein
MLVLFNKEMHSENLDSTIQCKGFLIFITPMAILS